MKSIFREYFPLTDGDISDLWNRAIIVFDTNTILRFSTYRQGTIDSILRNLEKLGDRLWIPSQIGWEYNRNRFSKIEETKKLPQKLVNPLLQGCTTTLNIISENEAGTLKKFSLHPEIEFEDELRSTISEFSSKLSELLSRYHAQPLKNYYDGLHERIGDLYEGKVGSEYSGDDLETAIKEGKARFSKLIPPGFEDVPRKEGKGEPDRSVFGDYIIWKQIKQQAKQKDLPIIFITEDNKKDWWLKKNDDTIGPLPELRKEFFEEVGQIVYFYRLVTFFDYAQARLSFTLPQEALKEISEQQDQSDVLAMQEAEILRKERINYLRGMKTAIPSMTISEVEDVAALAKIRLEKAQKELHDSGGKIDHRAQVRPAWQEYIKYSGMAELMREIASQPELNPPLETDIYTFLLHPLASMLESNATDEEIRSHVSRFTRSNRALLHSFTRNADRIDFVIDNKRFVVTPNGAQVTDV